MTASGLLNTTPGIALPGKEGLGQMHEVVTPDGRRFMLPQIDRGPAAWTGRGIDINSAAANMMGYTSKNFPTDAQFQVGRSGAARPYRYGNVDTSGTGQIIDRANAQQTSSQKSSVTTIINSNGTKANVKVNQQGPAFADSKVQNHPQMQPTDEIQGSGP